MIRKRADHRACPRELSAYILFNFSNFKIQNALKRRLYSISCSQDDVNKYSYSESITKSSQLFYTVAKDKKIHELNVEM